MTIRVGVVGTGIMGRRMIQRMTDHGGFAVTALWDPDVSAMETARELAQDAAVAPDTAGLVAREDVDLVYVASPPAAHLGQAGLAFDAGKAVLCEKPLAVDLAEAEAMAARVTGTGLRAAVNYPLASSPALAHVAQVLAAGGMGRVTGGHVEMAFREWPRPWQAAAAPWLDARVEGGFTREVGSHFLFLLLRLLGPLEVLSSDVTYAGDAQAERGLSAKITAGGVLITITGSVGLTKADDSNAVMIEGDGGAFRFVNWTGLERLTPTGWAPLPEVKDRQPPGHTQLDAVVAWMAGRPSTLASFAEALAVQRAVERLLTEG